MAKPRELPVPDDTHDAEEAIELIRGWLIDKRLICSLLPTAFEDPAVCCWRTWRITLRTRWKNAKAQIGKRSSQQFRKPLRWR